MFDDQWQVGKPVWSKKSSLSSCNYNICVIWFVSNCNWFIFNEFKCSWDVKQMCEFVCKVIVLEHCPVCQAEVSLSFLLYIQTLFPRSHPCCRPWSWLCSVLVELGGRCLTSKHSEISRLQEHKVRDLRSLWHGQNISTIHQTVDFNQTMTVTRTSCHLCWKDHRRRTPPAYVVV